MWTSPSWILPQPILITDWLRNCKYDSIRPGPSRPGLHFATGVSCTGKGTRTGRLWVIDISAGKRYALLIFMVPFAGILELNGIPVVTQAPAEDDAKS